MALFSLTAYSQTRLRLDGDDNITPAFFTPHNLQVLQDGLAGGGSAALGAVTTGTDTQSIKGIKTFAGTLITGGTVTLSSSTVFVGQLPANNISGLGTAASRNVGAIAGTVAAGDDSRIVAGSTALQPSGSIVSTSGINSDTTTALATKQDASTAVTLSGTQTLTNKTLTGAVITNPSGDVALKTDVVLASQVEAEAGVDTAKLMTPFTVAKSIAVNGGAPPILLTPAANLELPAPAATIAGAKAKYYITPSAVITLTMNSAIKIPSDSTFISKTLTSGKLYIVQLEYSGSFWMLSTVIGGY